MIMHIHDPERNRLSSLAPRRAARTAGPHQACFIRAYVFSRSLWLRPFERSCGDHPRVLQGP